MVDSEYSTDNYKFLKMYGSINKIYGNDKIRSWHLKTKRICKYAVAKMPFVIKDIPDWYQTQ